MTRPAITAVLAAATLLIAASPPSPGFYTAAPMPTFTVAPQVLSPEPPSRFAPAPLPNRDAAKPPPPRPSRNASVAPSLFTRTDQYYGEGMPASSSAQREQERRLKPGAGLNLSMPLQ